MTELFLPLDVDAELSVGEWLAAFRNDSAETARRRLEQFWAPVRTPEFRELAALLLEAEDFGIVDDNAGFLFGQLSDVSGQRIGDRWYLPCRDPLPDFAELLRREGHAPDGELFEFLTYFGGVGDDLSYTGQFMFYPPWRKFTSEVASWFDHKIKNFADWEDALMLYEALDGSVALIRNDGAVGWWMTAELRVRHSVPDLAGFITHYIRSRKSHRPFDCYSPE
jgi:hypothetical protein